jgi:cbb3-type cytochrome c oxidase subunit III
MRSIVPTFVLTAAIALATVAARPGAQPAAPDGKQVYAKICATCHQANGAGLPEKYPPLAGSEWATGDEARLVRVILHGLTGPIDVEGETFNAEMPPWGPSLGDADIAAVATYVRSSWGNAAAPVAVATVTRIRAATSTRTKPWTAKELAQLAIPVTK